MNIGPVRFGERRYRTRLKYRNGWPELTALVDILFLSMLFFVPASLFVKVSGVSVSLPRVRAQNTAALARFVITLTPPNPGGGQRGNIYFRDKLVDVNRLREELSILHDNAPRASVIIRADRNVPFEMVAEVMAIAESAQLPSFIAVAPPDRSQSDTYEI